ncbi:MAG: hypothetical protein QOE31_2336 [Solirubrobacteraceae bacterium]|jgi:hypothetical protein|nr:hypothetical protein [Solirubrobacteraceae bacterium]MEA2613670.1 hypothetical protein [Chloroflexota bacterium]
MAYWCPTRTASSPDDGAKIIFHLGGYSHPIEDAPKLRASVSPAMFETDDGRYRWLNVPLPP